MLATLRITYARVDGRELEGPPGARARLTKLVLEKVSLLDGAPIFSIRSGSLQELEMSSGNEFTGVLRLATPEFQVLNQWCISCDTVIAAPKLSELKWHTRFYDPSHHHFLEAGRHLRRMKVETVSPTMALMNRFDIVDELNLTLSVEPVRCACCLCKIKLTPCLKRKLGL